MHCVCATTNLRYMLFNVNSTDNGALKSELCSQQTRFLNCGNDAVLELTTRHPNGSGGTINLTTSKLQAAQSDRTTNGVLKLTSQQQMNIL
jgi:hypothetical protein